MKINNFDLIKDFLEFGNEDLFYMIQIIQRRKDTKEKGGQHRVIKDYYINSIEKFVGVIDEIIKLCELFTARAYIRLSRRSYEEIAKDMIVELGQSFRNKSYKHLRKIYSTAVGRSLGYDKLWIIDLDGKNVIEQFAISEYLKTIRPIGINKVLMCVPTPNGVHLITIPFDVKGFRDRYKDIDIHKNNPTLLYF